MKVRFFYVFCILIVLATSCLVYGFFIEPKRLIVRDIAIDSYHYKGPEVRIAFLSDLHIGGKHVSVERVASIKKSIDALEADIIIFGGDFVSGHEPIDERDESFKSTIRNGLVALSNEDLKPITFTVLGNHDVWYDTDGVSQMLSSSMTVLSNSMAQFDNFCIVGLQDHDTQFPNSDAFLQCDQDSNIIAVMHSPDSFSLVPSNVSLALAGHTHGGQINLPFIGRAVTATQSGKKYAYGEVQTPSGVPAYVTSGVGTSILSARFRASPEVVLITLRPQP